MTTRDIQQLCPTCNSPYTSGTVYCGTCGRPVLGVNDKTTQQFSTSMPTSPPYLTSQPFSPVPVGMQKPFWTSRKIFIFSTIMFLLLLLIGGGLFEVAYQLGKNSVQTGNTPPGSTRVSGTTPANSGATNTPAIATPTTIPTTATTLTPSLTPSSTHVSQPGTVLYQEDGSDGWQGWALSSDWRIVDNNKLLSDDGSAGSNQAGPSAIPPFTIPAGVQNFAHALVVQATDNTFLPCGSQVGMVSSLSIVHVSSFKVIQL